MEPILALSYYVEMREQLNSCLNPLAGSKYQLFAQADQRRPITTDVPTEHPMGCVLCLAAQDIGSPEKLVGLNNPETIHLDRPKFSTLCRIKAGLIQSAAGLLLFVGLMLAESFFYHRLTGRL
jgi:hypothetical protein